MLRTVLAILFISNSAFASDTLIPVIFLDDVVISEENNGFTVEDFVRYVKNDTTFYMGFKYLRYYTHDFTSELLIFNKKGKVKSSIKKQGKHYSNGNYAFITQDTSIYEGKVFKRSGKYRYYTPKAFDEVFFPKDTIPVSLKINRKKSKGDSQNMRDAKTIGFSVGSSETEQKKGGLSKKLEVFDISMQKYYDYIISDTLYKNKECYVFNVSVKENLKEKDKKKALIRSIVSYFDKENFNVIYREYKFKYNHTLFSLDMDVIVNMDYVNSKHVPIDIYYKGFWNVVFFKPERAEFRLFNTNYIVQ